VVAVREVLPESSTDKPPIVLVHGAANSASVWTYWQRELAARGWASYALDLRAHGVNDAIDLSRTTMQDYADDVRGAIQQLDAKPAVMGWSMGGLVAMMAAARGEAIACVALAPSKPVRAINTSVALRDGEFGPEEYGITSLDVDDQPAMPDLDVEERAIALASLGKESRRARDERKRGVVIESLPCPLLIVTGSADRQFPTSTYDGLWLPAERIEVEGASHWGLVLSRRAIAGVVGDVVGWLEASGSGRRDRPAPSG
jgi:pimeloyl-ACP methyl ester carboxylesterase